MAFFDGHEMGFSVDVVAKPKAKKSRRMIGKSKDTPTQFIVSRVTPNNVAEGQGVEVGDLLLGFNSKPLSRYGITGENHLVELRETMRTMQRPVIAHFNKMDAEKQQPKSEEKKKKKGFQFLSDKVKKSVEVHNTKFTESSQNVLWSAFRTDDGTTYYYHRKSKETVWHLPDSDWQITFERQSGKPYFYNKTTRETVWDKPPALSHVEVKKAAPMK
jgi:hypothetical protein